MAAISYGALEFIEKEKLPKNVLAYKRQTGSMEILVVMNFGNSKKEVDLTERLQPIMKLNAEDNPTKNKIVLSAFGAVVLKKL
jgi:hypothetical protein